MLRASYLLATLTILGTCADASAAKTRAWTHAAAANYEKAQFRGAVVSSEGTLRLARQLKPLADLDASHVWDTIEDGAGDLWIATGDQGRLYKLAASGTLTLAYEAEGGQILCLARASDGTIYAGTGPDGTILRIGPNGIPSVFCRTNESYVWSLAVDPAADTLYAGTGPHGRIYRIAHDGNASLFYATHQNHVLAMTIGGHGNLYAGTDKTGLVYRFSRSGQPFVLFHAPQAEVRVLVSAADGVYAGTSSPGRHGGSAYVAERDSPSGRHLSAMLTSAGREPRATPAGAAGSHAGRESGDSGSSSPAADHLSMAGPASAGENSVYHISDNGGVREIFRDKVLVLGLAHEGSQILVGTGMEGRLFDVNEATKERSQLARLDHGQVQTLYQRRDGSTVVGTGDPGRLYVLQDQFVSHGTVVSEVLDAHMPSRWGALRWRAETPPGTRVSVATRSGNLADPDETWSDWSAEQTDPDHAAILAPSARFLQFRVSLSTQNPSATPELRGITLRYATLNQAPEVSRIEVPDLDATTLDSSKKLTFKWSATDPNDDVLTYDIYIRKDGWPDWVLLAERLEKKEYEWDSNTVPAGVYQLKVVASDRKDNASSEALTGSRISDPFPVAHEAPAVTLHVSSVGECRVEVTALAVDPMVRLVAASYAIDGKAWINVFPADGLFDTKSEAFHFIVTELLPGTHIVVLRVSDAAGNVGSGDAVFAVRPASRTASRKP